jgi:hypothetical protein
MVEIVIPLLAQACGVVLPTGSGGGSSATVARSRVGGNSCGTRVVGDDLDLGDGLDNVAFEPPCNDGSDMGPGRGGGFTARGVGGRGPSGGLGGAHFASD